MPSNGSASASSEPIPGDELEAVLAEAFGPGTTLLTARITEVEGSSGAATGAVQLVTGTARRAGTARLASAGVARRSSAVAGGRAVLAYRLIDKRLRPPAPSSPRAAAAFDPTHFSYWRREANVYRDGLVPVDGDGVLAPRCVGIHPVPDGVRLWLLPAGAETAPWDLARYRAVVGQLARWHDGVDLSDVDYAAGDQLRQRIERTDAAGGLDWDRATAVDVPGLDRPVGLDRVLRGRLAALWDRRYDLLDMLDGLPRVACHGDFHQGNLFPAGAATRVIDWATLGHAAPGFDLAHLVLGMPPGPHDLYHPAAPSNPVLDAYLAALGADSVRAGADTVRAGFAAAYALVATSRLHWYLTRGRPDPALAHRALAAGRLVTGP